MAITYPLTAPAELVRATRFSIRLRRATAMAQSPFTARQQVYSWPFAMWEAEIDVAMSLRNRGAIMEAFVASLRGRAGTFLFGPLHACKPRGTVNTTGVQVSTAAASGATQIVLKGMGATKTLLRGDYLQIGTGADSRLYMVVEDATSNGSGVATVSIEPGLRAAAALNAAVTVLNPVGVWRLNTDGLGASITGSLYDTFSIPCIEAL